LNQHRTANNESLSQEVSTMNHEPYFKESTSARRVTRSSLKGNASDDHPTENQAGHKRISPCPMATPKTVYIGCGQIRHIGNETNSIAVEMSMGKRFMITLKGKLSPDVRIESRGRPSSILDFNIGDNVTIHWRNTKDGILFLALLPGHAAELLDIAYFRGSHRTVVRN
jgi:hypothetical protein